MFFVEQHYISQFTFYWNSIVINGVRWDKNYFKKILCSATVINYQNANLYVGEFGLYIYIGFLIGA